MPTSDQPDTYLGFLRKLIVARISRGLTPRAAADIIGVTSSALLKWEREANTPTASNAQKWADALGVPFPSERTDWFARVDNEVEHGTYGGEQWHRKVGDLPVCDPCLQAASAYKRERRRLGKGDKA